MNTRITSSLWLVGSLLGSFAAGCGGQAGDGTSAQSIVANAAPASDGGASTHGRGDGAHRMRRLDRNGDGTIQLAELPARMQERLRAADTNGDGVLATDELAAHAQARREARFAGMDANHDGAITADEAGERRWERLGQADADHDGRVTRQELEQAHAAGVLGRGHGEGGFRGHFGRHGARNPEGLVKRFDRDGDGKLQVAELPARMQARLGSADADHDGVVSTTELTAARAQFRAAKRSDANQ